MKLKKLVKLEEKAFCKFEKTLPSNIDETELKGMVEQFLTKKSIHLLRPWFTQHD
jgi:hypothetical protein